MDTTRKARHAAAKRRWRAKTPTQQSAYRKAYFQRPEVKAKGAAENRRQRRLRYLAKLLPLKYHPCMDCNGVFPPECMDFDHRPGETKLFSIGLSSTRQWDTVVAEIAKCDLVCANCHRIRTVARLRKVA